MTVDPAALAFALVAGAVAAFNPCGFALLPAYLGLLVAGEQAGAVPRALRFAGGMTVGFVAVFGLVGVLLAPLALSLERYLPAVAVVVGVLLVGLGCWLLAGKTLAVPGLAGRGSAPTGGGGRRSATASRSRWPRCPARSRRSWPPSRGRCAPAGRSGWPPRSWPTRWGWVWWCWRSALAVATASARAVRAMRRAGAVISRASGVLLVLAGGYVAWYGWVEIRALAGGAAGDPVVGAAVQVQAVLTELVAGLGAGGLLVVAAALAAVLGATLLRARARR